MLARKKLARRNLTAILSVAAAVGILLGSYTFWLSLQGQSRIQAPWPLMLGGLACLGVLFWLRTRDQVAEWISLTLVAMLLLANLSAIALNGVPAMTFPCALVVLVHVVLTTRTAAVLSGAYLLGSAAAVMGHPLPIDPQITSRMLGAGLGVMLAMQMLARHWDRLDLRFGALSKELQHTIEASQQQIAEVDAERGRVLRTDAMTGLPNGEGFVEAAQARLTAHPEAVVARLHLQRWRSSMATLQYAEQQALFQLLLKRCTEALGPQALIGRAGVDELLILLPAQGVLAQSSVDRLVALQAALARPILSGQRVALTDPAVGYARAPLDERGLPALMEQAHLACQSARLMHGDEPVAFERRLQNEAAQRTSLATDLAAALDQGQTTLRFQPVFDARSLSPRGAISRMVWNHPVFGQISPGSAREATDNSALTHRVTVWRLQQAVSHARSMRRQLGRSFRVSLSLPLVWLNGVIKSPGVFLDELTKMQIEPDLVVLEIPEEAMLHDTIGLMQIMSLVRSMGMGVALDRFGAGFSSFSFLDRMALDYLKIDRSFVAQVGRNERETAVCRAIVRVAHELGIRVVADGIRHAGQASQLAQLGCDLLHGDGLAAAMSGPDLTEWVLAHPSRAAAQT